MNNVLSHDIDFFDDCLSMLTEEKFFMLPSEFAETYRHLSDSTTSKPGPFSFNHTPYLREIIDCFAPNSPVRQVALMKAAHVGGTVGVIENLITYGIGAKPQQILFATSTDDLAEKRMTTNIEPAIESCGLKDKIFSQSGNKRRTGDKLLIKEFVGGVLHAIGANAGSKTRSMSYRLGLIDEIDSFPDAIKKDGDIISLIENRIFKAFRDGRAFYISTPLTMQTSHIYKLFLQGDQRFYNVPCKHCGEKIILKWFIRPEDTRHGSQSGILFDMSDTDRLIPESVRYKCQLCGSEMHEHDKVYFMPRGEWIATAESSRPEFRSYHINSLYAPVGVYSWTDMVYKWLKAWDVKNNRIKDIEAYRDFRQTDEGWPFEEKGDAVKYERIIRHRRMYQSGMIPNRMAEKDSGSKILLLIASVDVQKDHVWIDIKGYCRNGVSYTIAFYQSALGDTIDINSPCWSEIDDIINNRTYHDEIGNEYRVVCTFIDAGHNTDTVERFCQKYPNQAFPVFGRNWADKDSTFKFSKTQKIATRFDINTDRLKDRLFASLNTDWNDRECQPEYYYNFPEDLGDWYFNQLGSEYRVQVKSKLTGAFIKHEYRPLYKGVDNHAIDTAVYNLAALDYVIDVTCEYDLKTYRSLSAFWEFAESESCFYRKVS